MDEDNNNKENNIFNDQNTLPFFNGQTSSFHVPQTHIASNSGFVKDNTFDGLTSIINNNNGLAGQNTAISTGINNNNNGFAEQNLFNANNNSAYQNQNNFVDQLNYIIFLLHQLLDNKNKQQ
ncbi:2226_t:CDS:2 [Entrophospora sp. SA101]|nr:5771_t:CDS:2 [Entrophospora sp. SA101]CAJ0768149.1 2226_t:CDS:2 [Entrophospora sp. SA101]